MSNVGTGTTGTILQAQGAGSTPKFSTATYPTTAGTNGNVLTSDGTDWSSVAPSGGGITQYFSTYLSAPTGNVTGDGTLYGPILFDGILTNIDSNYNSGTGLYTAPTTGQYCFTHTVCFNGGDVLTTNYLSLWNGSAFSIRAFQITPVAPASNTVIFSATIFIPMTAGDTMGVSVNVGGTNKNVVVYGAATTGYATTSTFSGFKVAA